MSTINIFIYFFAVLGFIVFMAMVIYFGYYFVWACKQIKERFEYELGADDVPRV